MFFRQHLIKAANGLFQRFFEPCLSLFGAFARILAYSASALTVTIATLVSSAPAAGAVLGAAILAAITLACATAGCATAGCATLSTWTATWSWYGAAYALNLAAATSAATASSSSTR